jgi:hypothetical protein
MANNTVTKSTISTGSRLSQKWKLPQSVVVWLGLIAYVILVKFILVALRPDMLALTAQFTWSNIAILTVMGFVGLLFYKLAAFPEPLERGISNRVRFLIPLGIGTGIAIVAILIDRVTGGTEFVEQQLNVSSFNVSFPSSLFVYTGGLVLVEAEYRILLLSFFMWLVGNVILRKKGNERVFWFVAVILSLYEPLTQGGGILLAETGIDVTKAFFLLFLPYFATSYPLNLLQAYYFKKYGFLSSTVVRLGYYLMWHVVYGSLIYPTLR